MRQCSVSQQNEKFSFISFSAISIYKSLSAYNKQRMTDSVLCAEQASEYAGKR